MQSPYNADGIRISKVYTNAGNTTTHSYLLDGTRILKETVSGASSYTLYFYYDAAGSVTGLEYNGTSYYFQKNLQGDIIRICDTSGNTVVQYTYDAWGKLLSTTGTLASTVGQKNPFRYRGYYFDAETGLFYLQTRYFDVIVGRFLNADGYVDTVQGPLGCIIFAYCGNNPVVRVDFNGSLWLRFDLLNSWNEIHNAVQEHIVDKYGGHKEISLKGTLDVIQRRLIKRAMCKYKRFRGHRRRAEEWLYEVKKREPTMFAHWTLS